MLLFRNARLITDSEITRRDLLVAGGKIVRISESINSDEAEIIDCSKRYLAPGFIDLHVHGGGGYSFMGTADDVLRAADAHLAHGVTSLLPTALAADLDTLARFVENVNAARAVNPNIIGAHLEGPFLSPEMCGAQNSDCLSVPCECDYVGFFENYSDSVKMVGVAPELDGASELGEYLSGLGITVSVAHSAGDYDTARNALSHGFSDITHIFNACTSLRREGAFKRAGTAEAGLTLDGYSVQVIADLNHLPAALLELIFKCKGAGKAYLISDGLEFSATEIAEGQSAVQKNGVEAVFRNGAMLTADGSRLAGGAASGIELVRNVYENTSASLVEAVKMMSATPAEIAGVGSQKGRIAVGYDADLTLFDGDFNLIRICRNGVMVK